MIDFDRDIPRAGTGSLKYDLRQQLFGDAGVEPMWVADMDFATPDFILDALHERLHHPIFGYGLRGEGMVQALVEWLSTRQGWEIDPDWILFSPGVVPSLALAVRAFTDPGDRIIVQPPVYPPFFSTVTRNGRELRYNPLRLVEGRYRMDFDNLSQVLDEGARMLMLCSPHNPGGRVWDAGELQRLVELCDAAGCLLLSDEIHADLVYPGKRHLPLATLSEKVVTLTSPGKTFNIAGITPSATIIADPGLRARFQREMEATHLLDGNLLGNVAFAAAYRGGADWLRHLLDYLAANRDRAEEFVARHLPGIRLVHPEATFLLWLDCRDLGMEDAALKAFFVERAGIGLSPGASFGPGGEGFMRMNIGLPRQRLEAALERIRMALCPPSSTLSG